MTTVGIFKTHTKYLRFINDDVRQDSADSNEWMIFLFLKN